MKQAKQLSIIWIKRSIGFVAITLWLYIIYTIAKSPVPFMDQASYCILSTMMTFGILSLLFKGLEYFER